MSENSSIPLTGGITRKRKSTRKSIRKSIRKSTRKSIRKSTRKSIRKSIRKSTRKSTRKLVGDRGRRKPKSRSKARSRSRKKIYRTMKSEEQIGGSQGEAGGAGAGVLIPISPDELTILKQREFRNKEILSKNEKLKSRDFSGQDLSNLYLRSLDFSGSNFHGMDLTNTDLDHAHLEGADLEGAKLEGTSMIGIKLNGAKLKNVDFSAIKGQTFSPDQGSFHAFDLPPFANFEGADLEGANLEGLNLTGAIFKNAKAKNINLMGSQLIAAANGDLSGADFTGANFRGSDLRYANLTGANLTGADLTDVNFDHANMTNAMMTQGDLDSISGRLTPEQKGSISISDGRWFFQSAPGLVVGSVVTVKKDVSREVPARTTGEIIALVEEMGGRPRVRFPTDTLTVNADDLEIANPGQIAEWEKLKPSLDAKAANHLEKLVVGRVVSAVASLGGEVKKGERGVIRHIRDGGRFGVVFGGDKNAYKEDSQSAGEVRADVWPEDIKSHEEIIAPNAKPHSQEMMDLLNPPSPPPSDSVPPETTPPSGGFNISETDVEMAGKEKVEVPGEGYFSGGGYVLINS